MEPVKDMIGQHDGMSIDRYPDRNGNYDPSNCRWATPKQQSENSSQPTLISFRGETHNLSEWATHLGISGGALTKRLREWSIERALTEGKRGTDAK